MIGIFAILTVTYFVNVFGLNLFSYAAFTTISIGVTSAYFKLSSILKELEEPNRRKVLTVEGRS